MTTNPRCRLFGIDIDVLDMRGAVAGVRRWIAEPDESQSQGCRFVVTPNVDHAVQLQRNRDLRQAYQQASMILADGQPIVWAANLLRQPLPERVPGSELVPALFHSFQESPMTRGPLRVFLLGAMPGVAETAADRMLVAWPNIETVGTYSPPYGFEHDEAECQQILKRIADSRPDLLVIGLGAPKQEVWISRYHRQVAARAALCVGATIDFLAGEQQRAPGWMQRTGLEWFHRMCSQPKRLVKRYAWDAWVFPQLVWKQWRSGGSGFPLT